MEFLVDNQLPPLLAAHLRSHGHDAVHVADLGLDAADDVAVWAAATAAGRVVISKDEDFVLVATRPGDAGRLAWVRLGNCRNAALRGAFDRVLPALVAAFAAGQRVVEIR